MIGILDLQGGVLEHVDHLQRLGIPARRVKVAEELKGLKGLILPGGESTCLRRLLAMEGMDKAIRAAAKRGLQLWGTCAGAILIADEIVGETGILKLMDITVERNAYGSQLDSFNCEVEIPELAAEPLPLVFIRAPVIVRTGKGVRTLLEVRGKIAAAESDAALVTTFHPELSPTLAFHAYFAHKCGIRPATKTRAIAPDWSMTSWTRLAKV
jgi:5'-phosphate synthase pdxT subunit